MCASHGRTSMKVAIRVDTSLAIGAGHLMRCLALAEELCSIGAEVSFICRAHSGHLEELIVARGHGLYRLTTTSIASDAGGSAHTDWLGAPWLTDAEDTRIVLDQLGGVDWLVVDHYAIDARWETCQRPVAKAILVIDDLADRPHDCDLLLDQNLHAPGKSRYDGLLPAGARRLLGPQYALLRADFAAARVEQLKRDGLVRRLLVFFGGVDADNLTGSLLDALPPLLAGHDVAVDVVLGAASPHAATVRQCCDRLPWATFYHQTEDMARLMTSADLAIGAAGTAVWERCCLGLPAIVVPLAENQLPGLPGIGDSGCAFIAIETLASPQVLVTAIIDALALALRAPAALRHQSSCAATLVDGAGCRRVIRQMGLPALRMRRATAADCEAIYAWRNHEEIRRQSRVSRAITLTEHMVWLDRVLADPQVDLLICEDETGPCGVLRYDHGETAAEVSIYRIPGHSGDGIGGLMLSAGEDWLGKNRPSLDVLRAEVIEGNPASLRMFKTAGYIVDTHKLEKRLR